MEQEKLRLRRKVGKESEYDGNRKGQQNKELEIATASFFVFYFPLECFGLSSLSLKYSPIFISSILIFFQISLIDLVIHSLICI